MADDKEFVLVRRAELRDLADDFDQRVNYADGPNIGDLSDKLRKLAGMKHMPCRIGED